MLGQEKGFSLIEVVVVTALAGVLLALSISGSSMLSKKVDFESSKVQLRSLLQQGRNLARNQRECVQLTITGQSATLTGYLNMSTPCGAFLAANIDLASQSTTTFDSSVGISPFLVNATTTATMVFNTQGGTDYGNPVSVTLTESIYGTTFTIMPLIGQIESN